jgi:hypothetical protein
MSPTTHAQWTTGATWTSLSTTLDGTVAGGWAVGGSEELREFASWDVATVSGGAVAGTSPSVGIADPASAPLVSASVEAQSNGATRASLHPCATVVMVILPRSNVGLRQPGLNGVTPRPPLAATEMADPDLLVTRYVVIVTYLGET